MSNKGGKRNGAGRPKGTPNKATTETRELFNNLVYNNSSRMQTLLDRVAEDNPAKAVELFIKMSEFVLPKLRSTELIQDTAPINNLKIEIIDTLTPLASSELKIVE